MELFCSACKQMLPTTEFVRSSSTARGYKTRCRSCRKRLEPRNPETARRWYRANLERTRSYRRFRMYGVSEVEYQALVQEQGGRCAICRNPPEGRGKGGVLVVDHDHETGAVRGLLCGLCNMGLGKFADSPERLLGAVAYLRGEP